MYLLNLNNITKNYDLGNNTKFTALSNVSLTFPHHGLISIVGKSGCGKSTLLNIIAGIDKCSSGDYHFYKRDMSEVKKEELELFLNRRIGFVFQHYYLLEDYSVIFNIALPLLIGGTSYKNARREAITLLEGIGFNPLYYDKKVKDLSGGEKQRVAILRSLITSPNVILADEPTGALDSKNSMLIMDILKQASKKKLVIVVSHNKELVSKYSDRIIEMREGRIINDQVINKISNEELPLVEVKNRKPKYWVEKIAITNIKKRFFRNLFSVISLSICLVATTLVLGFSLASGTAINKEAKKRLDYGVISISKEDKQDLEGTLLSLVQESRPNREEIQNLKKTNNNFIYMNNYELLLNANQTIRYESKEVDEILMRPVYNFGNYSIDQSLLIKGNIPEMIGSFSEVLINKKALEIIENKSKILPIGNKLHIKSFYEFNYYTFDTNNLIITDTFALDKEFTIIGVVDELDFMATPTIYYSYQGYVNFLNDNYLNNLSSYSKKNISWKMQIDEAGDNDELSSYSIKGFLKNQDEKEQLKGYVEEINQSELTATSLALTVEESLMQLVDASSKGMMIFLAIGLLGVVLIIGMLSFFSYTQDKKQSAILSCLGASRSSILSIYLFENVAVGFLSFFISTFISFPIIKLVNFLLGKYVGISDMVSFPMYILSNSNYDYLLLLLVGMLIVVILSTYIPILFSKKISIIKELRDE